MLIDVTFDRKELPFSYCQPGFLFVDNFQDRNLENNAFFIDKKLLLVWTLHNINWLLLAMEIIDSLFKLA